MVSGSALEKKRSLFPIGSSGDPGSRECAAWGQSICAVVVTYGDRERLVRVALAALLRQPYVRLVVLVNNNAAWDVNALLTEHGPERVDVVNLTANLGSAAGFAAGIQRAFVLGVHFVWLLDDDNCPEDGALLELAAAYSRLSTKFSKDKLTVLAYRAQRQARLVTAPLPRFLRGRASGFWGFDLVTAPFKLWRRMSRVELRVGGKLPSEVELDVAPYSGLLFHRAVVERYGLPRTDFVVYADDHEFTHRITSNGGAVLLIPAARVADMEASWWIKRRFGLPFRGWLEDVSDTRAFYGARNQTYLDRHCFRHSRLMFWINRRVYCLILWLYALLLRRTDRYRLLQEAIRDGLEGRLGMREEYPL